jgi:hypothetical protein
MKEAETISSVILPWDEANIGYCVKALFVAIRFRALEKLGFKGSTGETP